MSPLAPERTLAKLVLELSQMRTEDASAILDMLDPAHRRTVESLLKQYGDLQRTTGVSIKSVPDLSSLSPWLTEKVRGGHQLTPATNALLRECAEKITASNSRPTSLPTPSLFDRFFAFVMRRRANT